MSASGRVMTAMTALGLAILAAGCGEATPAAGTSSSAAAQQSAHPTSIAEVNAGGDIPDTGLAYVAFDYPAGGVTLDKVPAWSRTDSAGAVTFSSHFDSVRVQGLPLATGPTIESVTATEVPLIVAQGTNVVVGGVAVVTRNAGQAIVIKYQADSTADPVTGRVVRLGVERYDFWHSGTEVVLTLAAPAGSDNVDPWLLITNSLHWR